MGRWASHLADSTPPPSCSSAERQLAKSTAVTHFKSLRSGPWIELRAGASSACRGKEDPNHGLQPLP